jgi:hypothetical protein
LKEIFEYLVSESLKISSETDLGGNSAMMALRAHQENCTILLGARLNSHYFSLLFNSSILLSSSLSPITDIHLVLDYFSDQFWGSLKPARSNRFYLNMDEDNN